MGKTTYLCGLVSSKALTTKEPIIFINTNKNLRYRDFKRVLDWVHLIKGIKLPSIVEYSSEGRLGSITFISLQEASTLILPD